MTTSSEYVYACYLVVIHIFMHINIYLKPRNENPFNKEILAINNLILSPSEVNFVIRKTAYNKTFAIRNKIFGHFRFVKPRFQCIKIYSIKESRHWKQYDNYIPWCVVMEIEF
jgi:hypothetical protein